MPLDNANHNPLVSITVPVYNRPRDIARCLESLLKLNFPREEYEIIVVDNNSTDNTQAIIQKYPVKYVFEPRKGRGPARSKGVQESRGKYLAFIDSDCLATTNWLSELVQYLEENPHLAACGGRIGPVESKTWIERYIEHKGDFNQALAVEAFKIGDLPRFCTANALIRREILDRAGGFDEELSSSIDAELGYRLTLGGFQIGYADKAIVYHRHRQTLKAYCLRRFEIGRGGYRVLKKYEGILFGRISGRRIKFIASRISELLRLNLEFILRIIKNEKEYPERSFVVLEFLGRICSTWGGLMACLEDMLYLLPKTSGPKNLNLAKVFRKDLLIFKNGYLFKPDDKVVWFLSNDLIKFMDTRNHSFFSLNETSTRIWQALCETKDFSDTVKVISEEYHMPEGIVSRDTEELLAQLEKEHLIERSKAR